MGQGLPEGVYYTTFPDGSLRTSGESRMDMGGWGTKSRGVPCVQFVLRVNDDRETGFRRGSSWAEHDEGGGRLRSTSGYTETDEHSVTPLSFGVASMVGGTVIVRRKLLEGVGRWWVLLSGAFMVFVVTPALITGRGPAAYLALTGWSLIFVWIVLALGRTENSSEC